MVFTKICRLIILQALFGGCIFSVGYAQNHLVDTAKTSISSSEIQDSSKREIAVSDTNFITNDTSLLANDTTLLTSDTNNTIDSAAKYFSRSPNAVTSIVDYFAQDSVSFNMDSSTAYLYHQADLNYEDINLKANHVEISFGKNELFAHGTLDTAETLQGTPVFKQETYEVKSRELHYNFNSKKGLLRHVITQEGESYLHGEIVKKMADNSSYIRHGKYTTCNLDCPHYHIEFGKAKVIPNDKIVTGPTWIKIANIPILPIPFGLFPNSDKRTNGILMPTYGNRVNLGFYLEGLGYYFAVKDKVDFAIKVNLFMRGSFGVGVTSNYVKRYRFSGSYDLSYSYTPTGERTTKERKQQHDFKIYWRHQQDPKAHPVNRFSANIDFKTSTFSKNNIEKSIADYAQSKAMSVVNFSTSFRNRYSLGVNAELSQDLIQGNLDMKLPQINFGVSQFHPFRRKKVVGKLRWYENISMQYTMDMQNVVNTYDSVLTKAPNHIFDNYRTGMSHSIPIKSTIKILKHLSWTNSISFVETWQIRGVKQSWMEYDTIKKTNIKRDTLTAFFPAHNLSFSTGLSTTLYGMFPFKKGRVSAIRHTITPSVSFNCSPSINNHLYNTYYDSLSARTVRYSYIDGFLYGAPSYFASGSINITIGNRLEMKVRNKKKDDGEEEFKKVTLLDNLTISTGYDFLRDSLRWNDLRINGRTTLFQMIDVGFDFNFTPYQIDTNGYKINEFEIKGEKKRLFRFTSTAWNLSLGLNIDRDFFKRKDRKGEERKESPSGFGDWNISIAYNFSYNLSENNSHYSYLQRRLVDTLIPKYDQRITNSLSANGRFVISSRWTFNFTTGYNFSEKTVTLSEFYVERDLHCWIISFKWLPFGAIRGFEFGIRAKANILRDAKYDHKIDLKPL